MLNAEALILPSYSENFGNVVVEAMLCKTPVIISKKVGLYKEAERSNAAIIVSNNMEDIAKGMEKLITDIELKNLMY